MNKRTLLLVVATAIAAVLALSASGCAAREPIGHATVGGKSDPVGDVELPDYVSYEAGAELEDVTSIGLVTTFPVNTEWLTLTGSSDVTIDMTDIGCWLLMRQGSSEDLGVTFTGEDATDTVATLVALVGAAPESTLPILWRGNEGTISVDALVFVMVNDAGERVLAIARAFGSLDSFVYAELNCNAGVSTESVFAERVAPYLSVALS